MSITEKQEPVFALIKAMTKAEKRNFKLYATRLTGNHQAKFMALFDYLDRAEEYDEARLLKKVPVTKLQLPNLKAHLYRQLLVSIRLIDVGGDPVMQIREQIDFARILYDKCLYRQSMRLLDRAEESALALEQYTLALDAINMKKRIDVASVSPDMLADADNRNVEELSHHITDINSLSNIAIRLYSLHQTLGYARTQKDLDLILHYFRPRLAAYAGRQMSFMEKFYYYQAMAWYHYIRHDFASSYRYGRLWIGLFESDLRMKSIMYDDYTKGYARILEGLFMMRQYRRFVEMLERFGDECERLGSINDNAEFISRQILLTNRLNKCFLDGTFSEGVLVAKELEAFMGRYGKYMSTHMKMLFHYKMACTYFGNGNYRKCIVYLMRITETRDPQIRRDLQCYAKILNLIASYELGLDYNIEYHIRSVYTFLARMNDLNAVQREMLHFLKRLNKIYESDLKGELSILYQKLKPYENHPYERRTFFYLDVLSWLESKISGRDLKEIIAGKLHSQPAGQ